MSGSEEPRNADEPAAPAAPPRAGAYSQALRDLLRELPSAEQRFWILVVVVGLIAGLGAVALLEILRATHHLAWGAAEGSLMEIAGRASLARRLVVPILGGVLVAGVALIVFPMRGHGTAGIIESIWARSGRMPLGRTLLRAGVSILGVGLGAPLGREGALLQTGAAMASSLSKVLRLSPEQTRLLVACGASAGIAAAYNVPIGAALFGLEVLLGSLALDLFGPIVLACVVSTLVSRILIADHPSYVIPHYAITNPRELLLAVLLGVLLGAASALYVKSIELSTILLERAPRWLQPLLPVAAMAAVGATALALPQILGNGYDAVNAALLGNVPLMLLIVLPFVKLAATALAAGAGVPGGLFTPSLFYGALLGGAFGKGVEALVGSSAPPGAYALLGMGAVLSGTTHASVCAVLIIFELTGSYDVILPLMLAAVIAAVVSRRLGKDSLYTGALRRRDINLPGPVLPAWLDAPTLDTLVKRTFATVTPAASFEEVVLNLLKVPPGHDLYVATPEGGFEGVIVLDEIKGHLPSYSLMKTARAMEVMTPDLRPVRLEAALSEVAAAFSKTSLEHLPVVDRKGKLVGTVSKKDVMRHGRF